MRVSRGSRLAVALLAVTLLAAACGNGNGNGNGAATTTADDGGGTAAAPGSFEELVEAATEEGTVTIYSSQGLDALNEFAAAFEEEYPGIDVVVVRGIDGELATRVETERQTGGGPDLYVAADKDWVETHADEGWFVEPVGRELTGEGDYDAEQYVHDGNHFEVGAAVLTMAWNTNEVDGLETYEDLLDPEFAGGRLGVIEPTAASIVDFYLWLEETFGEDYVEDLAAQDPRIYPSALPIGEAIISGEIFAAPYAAPVQLEPAKESGAPVEYAIDPEGAWGARYFGMVLDTAPNPNAGQLLADFMVTETGQQLVVGMASSVVPVETALLTNEDVRVMDLEQLSPEKVAEYQERWNSLFR
jgi:iron(III) transport system substrate-binding protein